MKTFNRIASKNEIRLTLLAVALGMLATGCKTYQQQNGVLPLYRAGNLTNAVVQAQKMAQENAKNKDAVIWLLEEAAVMRANGQYEDSNKAFDQAEQKIDDYSEKAKVRLSEETGAFLSNQANLPYEGRYYDGIMLDTYRALNYLALGDYEKARPAIIRAYQRQQDAVEDNKRRIEKTQAAAEKDKNNKSIEKAQNNPKLQGAMQTNYMNLDSLKPYADYVNPFTVYLDGLYFMANAADASDLERAHKSLERVGGMVDNDYIKQDLAAMDGLLNGKPLPPTTYIIFETGCAPERDQFRLDLPLVYPGLGLASFNAAFPTLKFQDNYAPSLTVSAGGNSENTALLSSMDSVIGLDFKNELPLVITKTIASSITKTVAEQLSAQAAGQAGGSLAKFGVQIFGAIYNASVNIADERTWTTLPKEFQFCRLPTPADRKLEVSIPNGAPQTVMLGDGVINLVYVKSIGPATPLVISQFKLNGSTMFTPSAPAPAPVEPAPVVTAAPEPATPKPVEAPATVNQTVETPAAPTVETESNTSALTTTIEDAKASALNQAVKAAAAPAETATPINEMPGTTAAPAVQNTESESNVSAPATTVEPAMDVSVPTRPPEADAKPAASAATPPANEIAGATAQPEVAATMTAEPAEVAPGTNAPAEPAAPEPAK